MNYSALWIGIGVGVCLILGLSAITSDNARKEFRIQHEQNLKDMVIACYQSGRTDCKTVWDKELDEQPTKN